MRCISVAWAAWAADEDGWEGCLSVPGMRGVVPRHARIRYRGFDLEGRPIEREADGFHARVVQHECDHLEGRLYLDRLDRKNRAKAMKELRAQGL